MFNIGYLTVVAYLLNLHSIDNIYCRSLLQNAKIYYSVEYFKASVCNDALLISKRSDIIGLTSGCSRISSDMSRSWFLLVLSMCLSAKCNNDEQIMVKQYFQFKRVNRIVGFSCGDVISM